MESSTALYSKFLMFLLKNLELLCSIQLDGKVGKSMNLLNCFLVLHLHVSLLQTLIKKSIFIINILENI